jgi:hypothetical protein
VAQVLELDPLVGSVVARRRLPASNWGQAISLSSSGSVAYVPTFDALVAIPLLGTRAAAAAAVPSGAAFSALHAVLMASAAVCGVVLLGLALRSVCVYQRQRRPYSRALQSDSPTKASAECEMAVHATSPTRSTSSDLVEEDGPDV